MKVTGLLGYIRATISIYRGRVSSWHPSGSCHSPGNRSKGCWLSCQPALQTKSESMLLYIKDHEEPRYPILARSSPSWAFPALASDLALEAAGWGQP